MKIVWTDKAVVRLEEIADFISLDSEIAATKWVKKVIEQTRSLGQFPNLGRKIPEQSSEKIRELVVGNYRLIYQVNTDQINILLAFDQSCLKLEGWG